MGWDDTIATDSSTPGNLRSLSATEDHEEAPSRPDRDFQVRLTRPQFAHARSVRQRLAQGAHPRSGRLVHAHPGAHVRQPVELRVKALASCRFPVDTERRFPMVPPVPDAR